MSKLVTDVKSYAKLLNSVAVQGTGSRQKRPLTPVECAKYIQRLVDEEQESLDKIAERLNLGKPKDMSNIYKRRDTTQISHFLNLLKVSKKSQNLAGWAYDEYPLIPFSLIAQLSVLMPDEQDLIIQSVFNAKNKKKILVKEDVKKIKMWRRENPDLPIRDYIRKVLKLKPVEITTHMVVSEIGASLERFIQSNPDYRERLMGILRENLKGKFYSVDAGKFVIAISMDEKAYKIFDEYQNDRGISYTKFLNDFLEDKIE